MGDHFGEEQLATWLLEEKLTLHDMVVLMRLRSRLWKLGDPCAMGNQEELAKELGIHRTQLNRHLKRMRGLGILAPVRLADGRRGVVFNPAYVRKGREEAQAAQLGLWIKAQEQN